MLPVPQGPPRRFHLKVTGHIDFISGRQFVERFAERTELVIGAQLFQGQPQTFCNNCRRFSGDQGIDAGRAG